MRGPDPRVVLDDGVRAVLLQQHLRVSCQLTTRLVTGDHSPDGASATRPRCLASAEFANGEVLMLPVEFAHRRFLHHGG
jgi:hypothetical protein